MPLLEVKNLTMHFPVKKGLLSRTVNWIRAVNGVTFHLEEGETLGLVGESGCGKTTVGRCLLRLIEATAGEVLFEGVDILRLSREELRKVRSRLQIIFQDPYSSLNPRLTVGQTLVEPLRNYQGLSHGELKDRVDPK